MVSLLFVIDQLAHIAVIVVLWLALSNGANNLWIERVQELLGSTSLWAVVVAYVLVTKPTSIAVLLFTRRWNDALSNEGQSLPDAGKWIGYLERVLIVTFILVGHFEGVGFC